MSLPPGFLEELRARISVTQVVGRKVSWDLKKSNQTKGDMWAPCPFHQEKTASFHVDDQKGFYYCFGCHAKGDAISFVKETENVNFIEAVEILAKEAGLQMPEKDPQAKEKSNYRDEPFKIMELTIKFYNIDLTKAVTIETRRGKINIKIRYDNDLLPGMLFLPFCFKEAAANILTNSELDPIGKIPELKFSAARIYQD